MMFYWFLKYVVLGYEEALGLKKLEISNASQSLTHKPQILVLSYLITTVSIVMAEIPTNIF